MEILNNYPESEASFFQKIQESIPEDEIIFIGNSMPIRYWQMVGQNTHQVFAARGANGIDGQISMACGLARGTKKRVHCIIGDLTFLYDIGICAYELPENLQVHVMNNKGGRIFERVIVPTSMRLEHEKNITKLIAGFDTKKQINEYNPDLEQSRAFLAEWSS